MEGKQPKGSPSPGMMLAPMACIVTFGIVGNVLTLITVLNKRCKKTSFIVVIAALAITDTIVLISAPLYAMMRSSAVFLCKLLTFCLYASRHISVWLVAVLTLERTFTVYWPIKVNSVCVPKTGFIVVAVAIATLLATDAHLLFGNTFIILENKTECGFKNTAFENFYIFYFPWIDLTIGLILPAIVIVASNSAILVRVFNSTSALTTNTQADRMNKNRHLLRMALLVSTAFLVLYLPRLIYKVSRPYIYKDTSLNRINETDANMSAVVSNLVLLNHGINFMLYIFSGNRFRNELRNTLCRPPATVGPEPGIRSIKTNVQGTHQNNRHMTNDMPPQQSNYQMEERKSNDRKSFRSKTNK